MTRGIVLDSKGRCINCGAPLECHEHVNLNARPPQGECPPVGAHEHRGEEVAA